MLSFFKKIKISGRNKFLIIVALVYLWLFIADPSLAILGIRNTFSMLLKIFPLLIVVLFFMSIVNLYVESGKIKKHMGKESGIKGIMYAIIAGILVSGPPYVLFPMLRDLKKGGARSGLLAIFLYNRNIKIPYIPVMIYYFGLNFTIIISTLIVLFSILNGMLVEFFVERRFEK